MTIFWVFFSLSFPNLELGKSYQSEFSFLELFYAPEQEGVASAALYITDLAEISKKREKKTKNPSLPSFSPLHFLMFLGRIFRENQNCNDTFL